MYPAFDNPGVPGMKDDHKTKAISFRGWQYSHRTKYFNQKYITIGYESEDDKNCVEIFISGSTNIELLILTLKTKYFYLAVVLEGFEI